MDTVENQNAIGRAGIEEIEQLEIFVFGRIRGGWPATGLNIGRLRKMAEEKRGGCGDCVNYSPKGKE